jgi:ribosomal protein S18 acetylase RimI-like enzyme
MSTLSFVVRPAVEADVPSIFNLIRELALYERAPDEVLNTPEQLLKDGFHSDPPLYFAHVVENADGVIFGFALCYVRYSTWKGAVLYLEDLYVKEPFRRTGAGRALFDACITHAVERRYKRITWQVLDWNQPAIDFYKKWNSIYDPEWINGSIDL